MARVLNELSAGYARAPKVSAERPVLLGPRDCAAGTYRTSIGTVCVVHASDLNEPDTTVDDASCIGLMLR